MASAPLNWLLKIGGDALQTTAQTICAAVNELLGKLDAWAGTTTVSSGAFSFSGLDDTQGYGYEPYAVITSNSTNKNPSSRISSITGAGTSSMTINYTTNADNGTTVKLRIVK